MKKMLVPGILIAIMACSTGDEESAAGPFTMTGIWKGEYSVSGKMQSCYGGGSGSQNCRNIPYSQKNRHLIEFRQDGTALDHYEYIRNNGGDTSESYQKWDSLTWKASGDSLYFVTLKMKIEERDWEAIDTSNAYAKDTVAYTVVNGKIRLEKYQSIDSSGFNKVDMVFSKVK